MTTHLRTVDSTPLSVQTTHERRALRLLERADVRAGIDRAARHWRAGTPGLLASTYAQLPAAIDEVALLVALQVVSDDPGRPRLVEISTGPHTWGGVTVPGSRWGINNPDTLYFAASIQPGATYLLRGRPTGGVPPVDVNISVQIPDVWGTVASLGRRDICFDDAGEFAVVVGDGPDSTTDDGQPAARLPIGPGGRVLMIRQTLADWSIQLPYDLAIERTAGPGPAPDPGTTEDDLARRLVDRLAVVVDHNLHGLQAPIFAQPANTIPPPGAAGDKPGYLVAQRNTLGHFRLQDEQALIVTVSPGGAGYAAVAATTVWGVTTDSAAHRNSVNSHQAHLDPDGRFTVVVSRRDPGVANWLDPGDLAEGILMLRWQLLGENPHDPTAASGPAVQVRASTLGEVAGLLPPGTVFLSEQQRKRQLTARDLGYGRRFERR